MFKKHSSTRNLILFFVIFSVWIVASCALMVRSQDSDKYERLYPSTDGQGRGTRVIDSNYKAVQQGGLAGTLVNNGGLDLFVPLNSTDEWRSFRNVVSSLGVSFYYCGDTICDANETPCSCYSDCYNTHRVGDGCCSGNETPCTAPYDGCYTQAGDGCCSGGENPCTDSACYNHSVGDGCCSGGENPCNAPYEGCPTKAGDGCCSGGETPCTDSACSNHRVGDGCCSGGETPCTAPYDGCPTRSGDGCCSGGETPCTDSACSNHRVGDGCCSGGETPCTAPYDGCPTRSGDGCCSGGENYINNPQECEGKPCESPEECFAGQYCAGLDAYCKDNYYGYSGNPCTTINYKNNCNAYYGCEWAVRYSGSCSFGTCYANCYGKNCGSDGCGGTCGGCVPSHYCSSGICTPSCGNGYCDNGETYSSCPSDCVFCGNGHCDNGETHANCPSDCEANVPVCGNGSCETEAEDCWSCSYDCGGCECWDRYGCPGGETCVGNTGSCTGGGGCSHQSTQPGCESVGWCDWEPENPGICQ